MAGAEKYRGLLVLVVLAGLLLLAAVWPGTAQGASGEGAASTPGGEGSYHSPLAVLTLLGAFFALILLPFIPGMIELYKPLDEYPLPVNMEYSKDPRYLGRSAWRIMRQALGDRKNVDGQHEVVMSKEEIIEVSGPRTIPERTRMEKPLYVRGDLTLRDQAACERDLFVEGNTHLAAGAQVRALACMGEAVLRRACVVTRWLDAEGPIDVGPECSVVASLSSPRTVRLAAGVKFRRLFGDPIETAETKETKTAAPAEPHRPPVPEKIENIEDMVILEPGDHRIDAGREIERPLVVKGDLEVGEGAVLRSSVRVYGKTKIEPGSLFYGDLFCEGLVEVGERVTILGNLFSQGEVRLERGVRIGLPGRPKSVIARMAVRLARDVRIHGYVVAEGEGSVV
jgi:NDP-sugar pyrophosphorylase family protein